MDNVYVGRIVSFHGVKGEIRILSDFPYKEKCFKINNKIIIDNIFYKIISYRVHKQYDMLMLEGFSNLNEVMFLKNKKVYIEKATLHLVDDEYLDEDLLLCSVETIDGLKGDIIEVFDAGNHNKILRINFDQKQILVPMNKEFIKKLDIKGKKIIIELLEGM